MNGIRYGRKRKGIIKHLKSKIEDWLESIEDEDLRKLAEKNVIVTGGSIASMLLGEKVNDYELIEVLKDIDPEKINSAYVTQIIDRIFD